MGFDATNYTDTFNGTSAATPVVSGAVALILEANPDLDWREVQDILVRTARQTDPTHPGWSLNGADLYVNHDYGFGAIDVGAAVDLALDYAGLPEEQSIGTGVVDVDLAIPDADGSVVSHTVNIDSLIEVQHIEVGFNATHENRGNLRVVLTSPNNTQSVLAESRSADAGVDYDWTFTTTRHWGELTPGAVSYTHLTLPTKA